MVILKDEAIGVERGKNMGRHELMLNNLASIVLAMIGDEVNHVRCMIKIFVAYMIFFPFVKITNTCSKNWKERKNHMVEIMS